ncbi:MAG: Holliday junction resolvase RuvX [Legionellales bacterium]|nr:Holliday junction resolvase RuvX [Legionellales bacterium]HBH10343.1 Holliday junction resolvase RuvX [Gammaproteobacteria bacterium]
MYNKTLLCFDYGEKRIGVAVGQTVTSTATALQTVLVINKKPDWEAIKILIDEWKPDKFIVGHPFTLHGTRQKMTDAAERFSRQLKHRFKLPVDLIDEQLSSYEAQQELKSTRNLDPTSAKLILETWFRENTNFEHRQINNNKED